MLFIARMHSDLKEPKRVTAFRNRHVLMLVGEREIRSMWLLHLEIRDLIGFRDSHYENGVARNTQVCIE